MGIGLNKMTYTTLISTDELFPHLDDPHWLIVDCRAILADPEGGRNAYLHSHIPGAVFVDLEHELSGTIIRGSTGRHPLPEPEQAGRTFSRLGIEPGIQVVAYDDAGGALAAGRLWWMLRWLGFDSAAVLDGGWQAWKHMGLPKRPGGEIRPPGSFQVHLRPELVVTVNQVERLRSDPAYRLVDVRASDRFRGQNEKIDPVAGHIPGAINSPYQENMTLEGAYRPEDELRQKYLILLGDVPAENVIFYCGSGVTAVHSILAMLVAGLGEGRLYPGSWSEWITDRERPIAIE
jgi:thiosulfate/3-mercaptopyruvate sulfurtransferase